MSDYILLKWGTLKGYDLKNSPEAFESIKRYHDESVSLSAMAQRDSDTQKVALCDAIRLVNGDVFNDWSGEKLTKEHAVDYIMNYGRKEG